MRKRRETFENKKRETERVLRVRSKKEDKFYISSKSQYNLGIISTINKVRGGDIYHFIFFTLIIFICS